MKVRGPYVYPSGKNAGRRYVIVINDDGTRRQLLYSRWLMEKKLGRRLDPSEHVHHKNDDKTDDRLANLKVIDRAAHNAEHGRAPWNKGQETGWRHGTIYGWMKKKCECADCERAHEEWNEARRSARKSA